MIVLALTVTDYFITNFVIHDMIIFYCLILKCMWIKTGGEFIPFRKAVWLLLFVWQ